MRTIFRHSSKIFLLIPFLLLHYCAAAYPKEERVFTSADYCTPANAGSSHPDWFKPVPVLEILQDKILLKEFSLKSLQVANAYGMIPLLKGLIQSRENIPTQDGEAKLAYLEAKLKASQMVAIAMADLSSSISEIQCRSEKLNEVIDDVHVRERKREIDYSILSILSGSFFVIVSGGIMWDPINTQAGLAIMDGFVTGYFGIQAFSFEEKVKYSLGSHILTDLYQNKNTAASISDSIWYLLNHPSARSGNGDSLRQILVQSWEKNGYFGKTDSEERRHKLELFFGSNGNPATYKVQELETLRQMVRQYIQVLNVLNQELQTLADEMREV